MTLREYITDKLKAFSPSEALLVGVSFKHGVDLNAELTVRNIKAIDKITAITLGEILLAPREASISENGFSVSWDFSNAAKYYLSLCATCGVTPDPNVVSLSGISRISDGTNLW